MISCAVLVLDAFALAVPLIVKAQRESQKRCQNTIARSLGSVSIICRVLSVNRDLSGFSVSCSFLPISAQHVTGSGKFSSSSLHPRVHWGMAAPRSQALATTVKSAAVVRAASEIDTIHDHARLAIARPRAG